MSSGNNKLTIVRGAADLSARSSPHPLSRLAPRFEPIDQADQLREADRLLGAVSHGKLQLIVEQINYLKQQAKKIIEEANLNMELHRATCTFEKRAGHTYHLYKREGEVLYFSLLSPEDWRGVPPHEFVGSFKLESDMTWTEVAPVGVSGGDEAHDEETSIEV
jgi:hypothetical protein